MTGECAACGGTGLVALWWDTVNDVELDGSPRPCVACRQDAPIQPPAHPSFRCDGTVRMPPAERFVDDDPNSSRTYRWCGNARHIRCYSTKCAPHPQHVCWLARQPGETTLECIKRTGGYAI